jgi:hypothetical protein
MSQHRVLKPAPQRVALVAGGNRGIGFEIYHGSGLVACMYCSLLVIL